MLKIKGGNLLKGVIEVKGSKNASLALIVASLLNKGEVKLYNVPDILDVRRLLNILKYLNVNVNFKDNILILDSSKIEYKSLLIDEVKKIRASSYLMGAFLSLFNKVEIFNPGGCNFSNRPIDFHLNGFKEFGAIIQENENLIINLDNIKSGYYKIPKISVGTTINLLLFGALKNNLLIIDNVALEPEVEEVIDFLSLMGVEIIKIKERTLLIKGNKSLNKNVEYHVKNDRIEAASLALLGASIGDNLEIKGFNIYDNLYLLNIFLKLNVPFKLGVNSLTISKYVDFEGIELETNPYPLLPTDIQPLLSVFLSLGKSSSIIKENIYPKRNNYIKELNKLNYNLNVNNNLIIINNSNNLKGSHLVGEDLRGTFALLMGSLISDNTSYLKGKEYIERGYEDIFNRLRKIGANIEEISSY